MSEDIIQRLESHVRAGHDGMIGVYPGDVLEVVQALRAELAASQAEVAELNARINKVLGWCATEPYVYHVDLQSALWGKA